MRLALISDTHYGFSGMRTRAILVKMLMALKKENVDVVLHAGDWGSNSQKHVEMCMKLFRDELGDDVAIIGTLGNHDTWVSRSLDGLKKFATMDDVHRRFGRLREEYKISSEYYNGDVAVFAYNSWYKTPRPPSNDIYHMPVMGTSEHSQWATHQKLIESGYIECQEVCKKLQASKEKHKIIVTHFQPALEEFGLDGMCGSTSEYYALIEAGATLLCYGHSHRALDIVDRDVRVLNSGGDYNKPKYKIFDL